MPVARDMRMRKRFVATTLILFAVSELSAHDDWSLNNHWNVAADFVYLKRNGLHGKHIVSDSNKPASLTDPDDNFSVMSTKRLVRSFEFEPGFRLTASYTKNKKSTVEATFMTVHEWEGKRTVCGNHSLSFPFNNPNYTHDFNMADKAKAVYRSKFYNAELNYWRHFTPRRGDYFSLSGIIGARYMQLNEKFNLTFYKGDDTSHYRIRTRDHLYGLQVGLDLMVNPTVCISWEFVGKVGPALNHSEQHTFLSDDNDMTTLRKFRKKKFNAVFFADVEGILTFQWTAHVNLHAGYKFMYLNGVVLAPEQIDKKTSAHSGKRVHDGGVIYIHGLTAGVNFGF